MELKDVILKRRAYRSLIDVNITTDQIKDLANSASLAASCFNKQPWRFIFIIDRATLEKMHQAFSKGNDWAKKASCIVAVLSKPDLDCRIAGRDYYLFDTGMAVAHLILKATDMGLVAHPIAGFKENIVKDILKIPPELTVITLVIIGKHSDSITDLLTDQQKEFEKNRPECIPMKDFAYINKYGNSISI